MLFNTLDFVFFFIIVITTLIIIKDRKFQHLFLLLASYFFFYYTSNYLISLLIFTTIWDFYFGKLIYQANNIQSKKFLLVLSLSGNLGLLGFFKYADFTITQFNNLGQNLGFDTHIPLLNLALPIAISFYTFHSITYTVSIYRGQMQPVRSFVDYAIFVTFFPQLVAGPILRANDFLPQLREKIERLGISGKLRTIVIQESNLKIGVTLMLIGFIKKMFFADNIAPLVNFIFLNPMDYDSLTIILGTIGFGIQIYCDFSGYSDIALGAATILGFKIPINFNRPYFAASPSEFWRRWHISLSTWLRDYLYIPLGGNKKSKHRTYGNLFVVMILGGLWHGASVNFIIWGTLHGLYLVLHRFLNERIPFAKHSFFRSRLGKICSIIITQYFVFLTWIPFRVQNTEYMIHSMNKFIFIDFSFRELIEVASGFKFPIFLICCFITFSIILYRKQDLDKSIANLPLRYWIMFLIGGISLVIFFFSGNPENFIYFRF